MSDFPWWPLRPSADIHSLYGWLVVGAVVVFNTTIWCLIAYALTASVRAAWGGRQT